jgi:hypothetical protein
MFIQFWECLVIVLKSLRGGVQIFPVYQSFVAATDLRLVCSGLCDRRRLAGDVKEGFA